MSSSDLAISVRGLSKSYTIAHHAVKHTTLAEAVMHRLRRPLHRQEKETFWALRDVSFDIQKGEVVGVIGRNGAGKSTLLKILSRITELTTGEIDLYGRVGSLLEVGTGFHPELTGRENIYLNGAILGMRKAEIDRQFDAIVDFSGVERFLDTPVKRFSSGMYVRLAFAVAAHLQSEIMVVDEVLAVGDAEFQKKCLGKMREVATGGRTIFFVSHQMQSISALCCKAIYLERGRIEYIGPVPGTIQRYLATFSASARVQTDPRRRPGTGEFRFAAVSAGKEYFECGEEKSVRFVIERLKPYEGKYVVSCHVVDPNGVTILQCDSSLVGHSIEASDRHVGVFRFKTPWLKPGDYSLDFFICSSGMIDRYDRACQIRVIPMLPYKESSIAQATAEGVIFADFSYEAEGPGASQPCGPTHDRMTNRAGCSSALAGSRDR